jgi:putative ABC transport system permease protein
LASLLKELRYTLRILLNRPGFAGIAVLTLGLGIGANSAIFTVVNSVLLRPLPFKEPDHLARLFLTKRSDNSNSWSLSAASFLALRDESEAFESVAVYSTPRDGLSYGGRGTPEQVYGAYVTADFFSVLGAQPLMGRVFHTGEDVPNADQSVIISYGFWKRYLGGDLQVLGQTIRLQDMALPIIGVMPPQFWFPRGDRADFWINRPIQQPNRNGPFIYSGIGRLRSGMAPAQVQADLDRIAALVRSRFPSGNDDWTIIAPGLRDKLIEDMRPALILLTGAVIVVLLIACVNVTNLMLARATVREREMALRTALGATRWQLIRQLLLESIILATIGAGAGLILAKLAITAFQTFVPKTIQVLQDAHVELDTKVFGVTALVAIISGVLSGLAPAVLGSRMNLSNVLNESGRTGTEGRNRNRLRGSLVVLEFALSLLLLIGGGLLIRSLLNLQSVNPGIRTDNVLTTSVVLPAGRYDDDQKVVGFYTSLLDGLRSISGVKSASISSALPPDQLRWSNNFKFEGDTTEPGRNEPIADNPYIDGGYFDTLGIKLLRGRTFDTQDTAKSPQVVVVNEMLARKYCPAEDPIGQRLRIGDTSSSGSLYTIVGIASNVKYNGLNSDEDLTIYQPFSQARSNGMFLILAASVEPMRLLPFVRREVSGRDSALALARVTTMQDLMQDSVALPRFRALLLSLFAGLALVLACIGVYGVLSYLANQRTREIGIRMALGADPSDVLRLVVGQGMVMALIGVGVGVASAIALMKLLRTFLFGVSSTDPLTFAGVGLFLTLIALLACYLPARRAARTDPMIALRYE